MGQTLSESNIHKKTVLAQNNEYIVGSSCMQGWRVSMEDAHTVLLSVPEDRTLSYFGVFDGHGGASISNYASRYLHQYILKTDNYEHGNIKGAIEEGFIELDTHMQSVQHLREEMAGSTAVIIFIKDKTLYCGNAGDSRAIAFVNGEVLPLSSDHKPTNTNEWTRIIEAGAFVEFNRVNGNLALSRALGDYTFKQNNSKSFREQAVTSFPDVMVQEIDDEWEFLVLACDGIWDVMTNEEVGLFVKSRMERGKWPQIICEELMMNCLAPDAQMSSLGTDNMTVIIVIFVNSYVKPYPRVVPSDTSSSDSDSGPY